MEIHFRFLCHFMKIMLHFAHNGWMQYNTCYLTNFRSTYLDTIEFFQDFKFLESKTAHAHSFYKIILFHLFLNKLASQFVFHSGLSVLKVWRLSTLHRILYGMFRSLSSLASPVSLSLHCLPITNVACPPICIVDSMTITQTLFLATFLNSLHIFLIVSGELPRRFLYCSILPSIRI